MMRPCDINILKTLELATEMIRLADKGDSEREDVGCGVLYGILRDSAYKLRQVAEQEMQAHREKGWWKADQKGDADPEKYKQNQTGGDTHGRLERKPDREKSFDSICR